MNPKIVEVKQLCEGCKKAFQKLEKTEIQYELKKNDPTSIKIISFAITRDIDGLFDEYLMDLPPQEQDSYFYSIADILEKKLIKEFLVEK